MDWRSSLSNLLWLGGVRSHGTKPNLGLSIKCCAGQCPSEGTVGMASTLKWTNPSIYSCYGEDLASKGIRKVVPRKVDSGGG